MALHVAFHGIYGGSDLFYDVVDSIKVDLLGHQPTGRPEKSLLLVDFDLEGRVPMHKLLGIDEIPPGHSMRNIVEEYKDIMRGHGEKDSVVEDTKALYEGRTIDLNPKHGNVRYLPGFSPTADKESFNFKDFWDNWAGGSFFLLQDQMLREQADIVLSSVPLGYSPSSVGCAYSGTDLIIATDRGNSYYDGAESWLKAVAAGALEKDDFEGDYIPPRIYVPASGNRVLDACFAILKEAYPDFDDFSGVQLAGEFL